MVSGRPLGIAQWTADLGTAVGFGGRDAADRGADGILRLEERAAVDQPAGAADGAGLGLVRPQQPGRASTRVGAGARGTCGQCHRARERRLQPARPAAGPGQPRHPAAGPLLYDHELRVLPAQHLVLPVPRAGTASVGAGERLAGESALHCRGDRRRHRRPGVRQAGVALGLGPGYCAVPPVSLPIAGVLLFAGVECSNPYLAVSALSLAFASVEITEASYSAATISVAREHTMAAWGVVGTGGNLGGVIGTPLVAVLSAHHAWTAAFLTGTAAAIISGVLWFWIDGSRSLHGAAPAAAASST